MRFRRQKVKPSTGRHPQCWQPGWGVLSQPLSASQRADRSFKSTRLSLSRAWYCLLQCTLYHPHSTTPSTPRWLLRLNGSKGQTKEHIDVGFINKIDLPRFWLVRWNKYGDSYYYFKFLLSSDGPGEKRLTSTVWSPLLALFLTQTSAGLTGPSSGPWHGCTKRLTRACKNTCVLLPPCAEGCVACRPKREVSWLPT